MKVCSACFVEKPPSDFWKQKSVKDGLQSRCKACANKMLDKKKSAEASRRSYHNGGKEKSREWHKNNRAKRAEYWQRQYAKNREKYIFQKTMETYVRRGAEGKFTKEDVHAMLINQCGLCAFCGVQLKKYHIDHILPISRGGTSWPHNLQLTCPHCNHSKRNRDAPLTPIPAHPEFI